MLKVFKGLILSLSILSVLAQVEAQALQLDPNSNVDLLELNQKREAPEVLDYLKLGAEELFTLQKEPFDPQFFRYLQVIKSPGATSSSDTLDFFNMSAQDITFDGYKCAFGFHKASAGAVADIQKFVPGLIIRFESVKIGPKMVNGTKKLFVIAQLKQQKSLGRASSLDGSRSSTVFAQDEEGIAAAYSCIIDWDQLTVIREGASKGTYFTTIGRFLAGMLNYATFFTEKNSVENLVRADMNLELMALKDEQPAPEFFNFLKTAYESAAQKIKATVEASYIGYFHVVKAPESYRSVRGTAYVMLPTLVDGYKCNISMVEGDIGKFQPEQVYQLTDVLVSPQIMGGKKILYVFAQFVQQQIYDSKIYDNGVRLPSTLTPVKNGLQFKYDCEIDWDKLSKVSSGPKQGTYFTDVGSYVKTLWPFVVFYAEKR